MRGWLLARARINPSGLKMTSTIRLPIQLGRLAPRRLLAGQLVLCLAAGLLLLVSAIMDTPGRLNDVVANVLIWTDFAIILSPFMAAYLLARAHAVRASDLEVSPDGIYGRDETGRRGLIKWGDIDLKRTVFDDGDNLEVFVTGSDGASIVAASASTEALARDDDPSDLMRGLIPWIRSVVQPDALSGAAPALLWCPSCRAPLNPGTEPNVTCTYCSTSVYVPPEVQVRLNDSANLQTLRERLSRSLPVLLRQPSAEAINTGIRRATIGAFATSVGAMVACFVTRHGLGGSQRVAPFVAFVWLSQIAIYVAAMTLVAARDALQTVVLSFGARKQGNSGFTCRNCGAALSGGEQDIVVCAFCLAENVMAVALPGSAPVFPQIAALHELEALVVTHRMRSWFAKIASGAAAVALVGGTGWFAYILLGK